MKLSIIIPSFNTKNLLRSCLNSLLSTVSNKQLAIEVIVVDNGSTDGSVGEIKKLKLKTKNDSDSERIENSRQSRNSLKIKTILNKINLGFAKAVNQGIREAKGEYVLLLNSDIIVKPGALKIMIDFVETHPLVGVVGGRLLDPEGSIQASVYHFPTLLRAMREFWFGQEGIYQKYAPQSNQPAVVDAVVGAVMLIPRKIIKEIGLLDEKYFMYFEDLDYCRRVKKAGHRTYYLPAAEFIHHHGASGEKIPELTHQWLVQSSKLYNGLLKYYLLTLIIWLSQKWQKIFRKS